MITSGEEVQLIYRIVNSKTIVFYFTPKTLALPVNI